MKNFGMVPEEIYSGKGRGELNHNHGGNGYDLQPVGQKLGKQWRHRAESRSQRSFIDNLLNKYYGTIPATFL